MRFQYALSVALAGSALALDNAPVPTSVSPASASSAVASLASRVVNEINTASTVASNTNNAAKQLNPNNVLPVGSNVAGGLSQIIQALSAATTDLATAVDAANNGGTLPSTPVHADYKPADCLHVDDPTACMAAAMRTLPLPQGDLAGAAPHAGSIAARAAQVSGSGSGSVTFTFSAAQQASIAGAVRSYAAVQNALVATLAQQRANIGYYLVPIRNSVLVLQGTADAFALEAANAVSAQYDGVIAQAKGGMDASLQITIRAYAA